MKNTLKKLKRIIIWFLQTWPRRALAGFLIVLFVISPFYFLFFRVPEAQAEWFDESWMYRQAITLTNSTGSDLTDFQVAVTVNTSGLISAGKMQSACQDMRFTDKNGQVLDYWIEENNPGCGDTSTKVWLKVPTVANGTNATTVYFYYGNSLASDMQNGDNVFEFFDDFSIDLSNWTNPSGCAATISSGVMNIPSSGTCDTSPVYANNLNLSDTTGYILETRGKFSSGGGGRLQVYQKRRNANSYVARFWTTGTSTTYYQEYNGSWSGATNVGANNMSADTWYNLKVQVNGSNNTFYVNGNSIGSATSTASLTPFTDFTFGLGEYQTTVQYDNVRIRQYASTDPSSSVGSEETGPGPVAYWQFDEGYGTTAHDSNIQGRDLTINNASWQIEEQCVSGKCMYFDGSGDYLSGQSNILEQDYTISLWVKPQNGAEIFWENETQLYFGASGTTFTFRHWTGTAYFLYSDSDKSYNQWYHVVITHDSSDGLKLYVDGVLEDSDPAGTAANSSGTLYIGKEESTNYFKGFVDEIKVYDYARSADQVKNDYNAGVGGGSGEAGVFLGGGSQKWMSDGLVGHWKMDESSWNGTSGEVIDSSGNGNNGTSSGGATTAAGKFGYGGSFAGDDDHVVVANSSSLQSVINSFSVSVWFNDYSFPTGNNTLVEQWYPDSGWIIGESSTSGKIFANLVTSDSSNNNWTSNATLSSGVWHNVVLVYDGATESMYIDGELDNSYSISGTLSTGYDNPIYIGSNAVNAFISSSIDDVRLYNRALSPDEIAKLYEWAPGPVGYWKMDEKTGDYAYDSSGTGNTGTLTNMESSDWTVGKYGGATQFDGVDEYIDFGDPVDNSLDMGTKNFTVSFWAKPDGTINSGHDTIVGKKGGAWAGRGWLFRTPNASTINFHVANELAYDEASTSITAGVWQYITGVRDGTTLYLYINGVLKSTDTNAIYDDDVSTTISLKSGYLVGWNRWAGTVDDIKIYDYARNQKQIVSDMSAQGRSASGGNAEPLLYLNFDEGYGTTAHDLGFGQDDGELYDGPSWTNNGKFGKALDFDGTNDRVEAFSSNPLEYTGGGLTISLWANMDSAESTGGNLVCKPWNGNGEYNYCVGINSSDLLGISMRGATAWSTTTTATLTADTWSHVLVAIDGTDDSVKIYKDGELVKSDNYNITSWTPVNPDTNVSLCIGSLYPYGAGWAGNTGYAFDGQIDEFKIYNYALSEEEVKREYNHGTAMQLGSAGTESDGSTPSQSASRAYCVPGDTSTCSPPVGEWKFDEKTGTTAYDTSGNGNDGTLTGSSATWGIGKVGAAASLTTENLDYIRTSQDNITGNNQELTVEAWVYSSDWSDLSHPMIVAKGVNQEWILWQEDDTANNSFAIRLSGSGCTTTYGTTTAQNNTWYHIAGTFSKTSGIQRLYINGKKEGESTGQTACVPNSAIREVTIGVANSGTVASPNWVNGLSGKIDDVKIFDYARTPAQIAWDYNRGAPVGWWKMDEGEGTTAHDASGNSNHGALTNMDSTTDWVSGQFNSALDFDGSDDYVSLDTQASSSVLQMGAGAVTVSHWVKLTSTTDYRTIFFGGATGGATGYGTGFQTGSTNIRYETYGSSGGRQVFSINGGITLNQWYHIVAIFDGINNKMKLYVNGVEKDNRDISDPGTVTYSGTFAIGSHGGAGWYLPGQIDDVRVYNYDLTPEQVKQIYNNGAINFR